MSDKRNLPPGLPPDHPLLTNPGAVGPGGEPVGPDSRKVASAESEAAPAPAKAKRAPRKSAPRSAKK